MKSLRVFFLKHKRIGIVICFVSLLCFHLLANIQDEHLSDFNLNIPAFISFAVFVFSAFKLFYKSGIAYWGNAQWHYKNYMNKKVGIAEIMDERQILDERQIEVVNNAHRQGYIILSIIILLLIIFEKWQTKSIFIKICYQSLSSSMILGIMLIPLAIIAWNEKEV